MICLQATGVEHIYREMSLNSIPQLQHILSDYKSNMNIYAIFQLVLFSIRCVLCYRHFSLAKRNFLFPTNFDCLFLAFTVFNAVSWSSKTYCVPCCSVLFCFINVVYFIHRCYVFIFVYFYLYTWIICIWLIDSRYLTPCEFTCITQESYFDTVF